MSLWSELRRRNVFRVSIAYLAGVWLLIQVASVVLPTFAAPAWAMQGLIYVSVLAFPLVLVLAWVYEWTPEGFKVTGDAGEVSRSRYSGRKFDFGVIAVMGLAIVFLVSDNYIFTDRQATANPRSIAVLPFANDSASAEDAAFFADGLHDELLTYLAGIRELKVISRTSVMEYRDTARNVRDIGRELGAASILESRVQRAGDSLRIIVQLIDAENDEHLWAETYNRRISDENSLELQSEMAAAIASALQATLSPDEQLRLTEVPTQNTQAYDFYLTGSGYFGRADRQTYLPLAIQQYERAIEEDGEFALAYAKLSIAHGLMYWLSFDRSRERANSAREGAERALALSPNLAEAHLAMGYYYYRAFRDYGQALSEFSLAERGLPGSSDLAAARAYVLRRLGRWYESIASMEQAIQLDPRNADLFFNQAATHGMLREYGRAKELLDRTIAIAPDHGEAHVFLAELPLRRDGDVSLAKAIAENPPIDIGDSQQWLGWTVATYERDFAAAIRLLNDWDFDVFDTQLYYLPKSAFFGITYGLAGQAEQAESVYQLALRELESALDLSPEDARIHMALAGVQAGLNESQAARDSVRRAMELVSSSTDAYEAPDYQLMATRVLAAAGYHDEAIEELEGYLASPADWTIEGLLPDPRLDPIRDEPRFQALVERFQRQ